MPGLIGRISGDCARKLNLAQVSCILLYVYVHGSIHTSRLMVDGIGATAVH